MADFSAFFDPADDPNQQPGQKPIYTPPPVVPATIGQWGTPLTGGGGKGGGGGLGLGSGDIGPEFDFSAFPKFNPKNAHFTPLTLEQAQNEPGYKFAEMEGQQGIERSAAARGALRTGGTLKDIGTWIHDFATRGYNDANQRQLNAFLANYQVEKDQFAPLLSEANIRAQAAIQAGLAKYGRYTMWNAPRGGGGGGGDDDALLTEGQWLGQQ